MKKLTQKLQEIKNRKQPGYMMHIVAGYPDMESSKLLAKEILNSGADILEIQIPFSDPVADGPVIANANEQALRKGTSVTESLELIQHLAQTTDAPILIMTYFNIVHHFGIAAFAEKAREIGVQGLIIPDYPFDEDPGNLLIDACNEKDLAFIQVLASTTRPERMVEILKQGSGFVYCMARTGTTGKKTLINAETVTYLSRVKAASRLPMAVGFGLSERIQVNALKPYADIMVVGSALINEYADKPLEEGLIAVGEFMGRFTGDQ